MGTVCLIVPVFPAVSETFITSKLIHLLREGMDVIVFCDSIDHAELARLESQHKELNLRRRVKRRVPASPAVLAGLIGPFLVLLLFCRYPGGMVRFVTRCLTDLPFPDSLKFIYLYGQLVRIRPSLLHFEFGALARGRMFLREALGSKIVVSFRGYDINFVGLEDSGFYDEVWELADAFHFLGQDLRSRAIGRGCPTQKPHYLIPPAISITKFSPLRKDAARETIGVDGRPIRIISVGRLEWKKGYEYGLDAIKILRDQGVHVVYRVIGDGSYLEAISFARHQLGLDECVELLGAKDHEEVVEHLKWADIFLHSAVSEGFCNAVLEAQAMMLPVVTSDADGLRENVVDGETGLVVPRRNPAELARAIRRLAVSSPLRQEMGSAGRRRVQNLFQISDQAEAFQDMYSAILATSTRR